MDLSVEEAAERLGVDPSRVRQQLRAGNLSGRHLAGRWLVDADDVVRLSLRPRQAGRPLAPWRAWALLAMLEVAHSPDQRESLENREALLRVDRFSKSALSQVSALIGGEVLIDAPVEKWRSLLSGRSQVHDAHAHPSAIRRLLADKAVVGAGAGAAAAAGADLVVVDAPLEVYVPAEQLPRLVDQLHLNLSPLPGGGARHHASRDSVALRVPQGAWPFAQGRAWSVALAADLLESLDARSAEAGRQVLAAAVRDAAEMVKLVPRGALSWVVGLHEAESS